MRTDAKQVKRQTRHKRIRARVVGRADRPRLCVYRSNRAMSAQLIDDAKRVTLVAANEHELPAKKGTKLERASMIGKLIAKKALEKGIKQATFDRGGFIYTGRVRAVAEAAREGGLKF